MPRGASAGRRGCAVGDLFAMLGQPHMLSLLHLFASAPAPLRFTELQSRLDIPPKTLSARLRALVQGGFLARHAHSEIPPRVEYEPTTKVRELMPLFEALEAWATRNSLTATTVVSMIGPVPPRRGTGGRGGPDRARPGPRRGPGYEQPLVAPQTVQA